MPSDNLVTNFKQAIEVLGGTTAAAEVFGYAPSRVCQWRDRYGTIPPELFLLANIEFEKLGYRPTWSVFGFRRQKHHGYELWAKARARWEAARDDKRKSKPKPKPPKKTKPPKTKTKPAKKKKQARRRAG
jgi:hypothetical protein